MSDGHTSETDRLIDMAAGLREDGPVVEEERREKKRHPYHDEVVLVMVQASGEKSKPMVLQARDLSPGGIRVVSRQMIHMGCRGAIQLMRSDGRAAVAGVQAVHCQYIGNMEHHTGMKFIPMPRELSPRDFVDVDGNMIRLDEEKARRKAS